MFLFIQFFIVCAPQDIVGGDIVEIRKDKQVLDGDSKHSSFISGVYRLACEKELCYLSLIEVFVFSEVSQSGKIHKSHSLILLLFPKTMIVPFGTIDNNTNLMYNLGYSTFKY